VLDRVEEDGDLFAEALDKGARARITRSMATR
jgi:hypothetical protein